MRLRALAVAASLAVVPVAAAAAAPAARTQSLEYVGGGITTGPGLHTVVRAGDNVGAVVFHGGPEKYVSVDVADQHGLPVAGILAQPEREPIHFCGATDGPVRVKPYENLTVFLMNGVCGDTGASVVTTGMVTATFTRG